MTASTLLVTFSPGEPSPSLTRWSPTRKNPQRFGKNSEGGRRKPSLWEDTPEITQNFWYRHTARELLDGIADGLTTVATFAHARALAPTKTKATIGSTLNVDDWPRVTRRIAFARSVSAYPFTRRLP